MRKRSKRKSPLDLKTQRIANLGSSAGGTLSPLADVAADAAVDVSKATAQVSKMASKNAMHHATEPGNDTYSMMGCDDSHVLSPGGK